MRKYGYATTVLAVLLCALMVAGTSSLVSADACVAQLGDSSQVNAQYYSVNSQIDVPVSAVCQWFSGGQLFAMGIVRDPAAFGNIGLVNATLTSTGGSDVFIGHLVFTIPPLLQGQTLQVSVSIYSNRVNGAFLTSATQTAQVFGSNFAQPVYPGGYWWFYP